LARWDYRYDRAVDVLHVHDAESSLDTDAIAKRHGDPVRQLAVV